MGCHFDPVELLAAARSRDADRCQEFQQALEPGVRALLRHRMGSSEAARRSGAVIAAVQAAVQNSDLGPEELPRCIREQLRREIEEWIREGRPGGKEAVPREHLAAARSVFQAAGQQDRAILERVYGAKLADEEIAAALGASTLEIARVRSRARAAFAARIRRP